MKRTLILWWLMLLALPTFAQSAKRITVTRAEYNGWKDAIILSNGQVEAVIVPSIGRVMQFRFVGEDGVFWENPAVAGKPVNPASKDWINFGGDKPWPAPQADWPKVTPRAWPPPVGFDASAWEATVSNHAVELVSPVDPHYGIRVRRYIKLDPVKPIMKISTAFEKVTGEPRRVAVWVITQLKDPEAITVPVPPNSRYAEGYNKQSKELPEQFSVKNGLITLKRDPKKATKIGNDAGLLTWIGDRYSLRITSPRVPKAEYPDNGSSAEVYTNLDPLRYVELEMLGPLKEMKVGDALERTNVYTLMRRPKTKEIFGVNNPAPKNAHPSARTNDVAQLGNLLYRRALVNTRYIQKAEAMILKSKLAPMLTIIALLANAVVAQAPNVTLRGVDGSSFSVAENKGKVIVLSFGATWVPMTSKELPALQKLVNAHPKASFYWVSTNAAKAGEKNFAADADLQAFATKYGLKIPVLRDADKAAYRAFGLTSLPSLIVIDQAGNIKLKHEGFDPDQAEPFGDVSQVINQLTK
jgi:peroxiredoxin